MRRKRIAALALAAALSLLTGCFSMSADEFYTPPKPASDYQQLDAKIKEVIAAGAEYAAPVQGTYTQPVQLMDLDGDGVQEALAFFRIPQPKDGEMPLMIYIYRQDADGDYQVDTVIQGGDTGINSIAYVNLDGGDDRELVVSWQISGQVYQLMAYKLRHGEAQELMRAGSCTDYAILDLDMDNRQEVVGLTINTIEGKFQADFYDFDDQAGNMVLRSFTQLSYGISGFAESQDRSRTNYLRDNVPALFVTSSLEDTFGENNVPAVVTDILAWRDGELTNITLNPETKRSDSTIRFNSSVSAQDIDGDGVLELPQPKVLPDAGRMTASDSFWSVRWVQYDLEGQGWPVCNTYYNGDDGWYLILPDSWIDNLALSRADWISSGERAVAFSYWDGSAASQPETFLTIYKLTGPNRTARSKLAGRFVLRTESDTIYAAAFHENDQWDCGQDQESLPDLFRLIRPS